MLSVKTTIHVQIGTVKFSSLFKESPCSPVVTFPCFGSEGHGVQPPQGDSGFCCCSFFVVVSFYCGGFSCCCCCLFFISVLVSTDRAAPSVRRKIEIMAFF